MNRTQEPANEPDPKAVAAAHDLREKLNAECVILLGSRARGDYRENKSDVDFITIINGKWTATPNPSQRSPAEAIQKAATDSPSPSTQYP